MVSPAPKKKHHDSGSSQYGHDFIVDCSPEACLHGFRYLSEASDRVTIHIPVEFEGGAAFVLRYYENDRLRVTVDGLLRRWEGTQTSVHCRQTVHETWLTWLLGLTFSLSLQAIIPLLFVLMVMQTQVNLLLAGGLVMLWLMSFFFSVVYTPFDDVPPNMVNWLKTALRTQANAQQSARPIHTEGGLVVHHRDGYRASHPRKRDTETS